MSHPGKERASSMCTEENCFGSPIVKEICLLLTVIRCASISVEAVDLVFKYKNLKKCDTLS